jgi:dolichyl-phosphooligosaccharide-protein glycotransferase
MNILKNKSNLIIVSLLILFIGISLFTRIYYPYNQIFTEYGVKFNGTDAYYHMRLVDTLTNNFPHLTYFDTYFLSPYGTYVIGNHFFDWLISSVSWIVGFGNPSQHTIDLVGAYIPVILACLVIIPVFIIGKTLFNKWVGLIGAGLIAVFGGEFMGRSILGATDHHIAEVLFSTTCIMFLVLAVKNLDKWKSYFYAICAGIFMGIYLLTWSGALLFVMIICAYFIVQTIIYHMQKKISLKFTLFGGITFLIALLFNLSPNTPKETTFALIFATLVPFIMSLLSRFILRKNIKVIYYIGGLVVLAGVFVGILRLAIPDLFNAIFSNINIFLSAGSSAQTTMELKSIIFPAGNFTLDVMWGNFGLCFVIAPIAFIILSIQVFKKQFDSMLIIWTVVILLAMLIQRRFAYYFAINTALLTGYILWRFVVWFGQGKIAYTPRGFKDRQKHKVERKLSFVKLVLAIIITFTSIFIPVMNSSITAAKQASFVPSDAWQNSLLWLKDNTPEPFGEDIYNVEQILVKGKIYPKPDYGITAWWDYGYFISRIAHRVPTSNPGQSPQPIKDTAKLFLSDDLSKVTDILGYFKTRYIMLDYDTTMNKFWAMLNWASEEQEKYTGIYYYQDNNSNQIKQARVYYPEYFKTLCVRLYNFDGKAVSAKPIVIMFTNGVNADGTNYRLIHDYKQCNSYQEALDLMATLVEGTCAIVSTSPFISPIDLEAINDFTLLHSSNEMINAIPQVKIFEYKGE